MDPGALIVPGAGHVLVRGPFAMVMSGSVGQAQDADATFAGIAQRRAWNFESVAAALQDLVVSHDLSGVAAILTAGGDPLVFIFDDAMAIYDGSAHGGSGREEWVTEMVMGQSVELRLTGTSTMPPQHGTSLRDGLMPGSGLSVEWALVPSAPATAAQGTYGDPPPPYFGAGQGAGPLAQYGHQPPPPTGSRVPPPPAPGSGRGAPGRVHHNPPPPRPE